MFLIIFQTSFALCAQAKQPTDDKSDYIKVQVKGRLIFEEGVGYYIVAKVRYISLEPIHLKFLVSENKVFVWELESFVEKIVVVNGHPIPFRDIHGSKKFESLAIADGFEIEEARSD